MPFYLEGENPKTACFYCGSMGHMKHQCPELPCDFCKQYAHVLAGCRTATDCGKCGKPGHKTENCAQHSRMPRVRQRQVPVVAVSSTEITQVEEKTTKKKKKQGFKTETGASKGTKSA
ncbi:hypothetical protein BDV29DRAFT_156533 [Aspergillus leporis]|uniref:CCHC-type domain-containing protein n=1 Tax=Aspergillus leporis TaxID=41062 RepID=A0A5N5X5C5_9EURO|nr:hypothetical protein BDV29DRAFT_156533 [Aspergillus leporis]